MAVVKVLWDHNRLTSVEELLTLGKALLRQLLRQTSAAKVIIDRADSPLLKIKVDVLLLGCLWPSVCTLE